MVHPHPNEVACSHLRGIFEAEIEPSMSFFPLDRLLALHIKAYARQISITTLVCGTYRGDFHRFSKPSLALWPFKPLRARCCGALLAAAQVFQRDLVVKGDVVGDQDSVASRPWGKLET